MSKATEVLSQLFEEVNDGGMSSMDGIYTSLYFPIHHLDIDIEPEGILKNYVKDSLFITNQLNNKARICVINNDGPIILTTAYAKREKSLDLHVTCSSIDIVEELPQVLASMKKSLGKYALDCGFTPGIHYYNLIDAWIPWSSARTVELEGDGWT